MSKTETSQQENYMSMQDVATYLNVHISWVQNHCSRIWAILPHSRLGVGRQAKRRFIRAEIDAFMQEWKVTHVKGRRV